MATARILHRKCSPSHGRSQLVPGKCYRPALRYYILELPGYILRPMLEVGLHFRNSCQHDHGFAGLIFRSRSDLIAGDAVALIGGRKMQRRPVDDDPSVPHAKKTAEIDHRGPY